MSCALVQLVEERRSAGRRAGLECVGDEDRGSEETSRPVPDPGPAEELLSGPRCRRPSPELKPTPDSGFADMLLFDSAAFSAVGATPLDSADSSSNLYSYRHI